MHIQEGEDEENQGNKTTRGKVNEAVTLKIQTASPERKGEHEEKRDGRLEEEYLKWGINKRAQNTRYRY